MEGLKTVGMKKSFKIKCKSVEQKEHVRSLLINMSYKDDKTWNDSRLRNVMMRYVFISSNYKIIFTNVAGYNEEVISYEDFCKEHNVNTIEVINSEPLTLDQLIKKFKEDVKSFGMDVEIVFK